MPKILLFIILTALAGVTPAMAYVGPGSSLGAVGVVLGMLATLLLTLISFIWYPLKRGLRKVRRLRGRARNMARR
ncbi:MAG: hypothetical protein J0I80_11510 [Sphingomonas sp.]|nr:hypothetical protein [Sphingomonas sp.]